MQSPSRRQLLSVLGGAAAISFAGCVTDDEPEFLVTDTAFSVQESGDMNVQVTVENAYLERRQGTLEVVVRYVPEDGEATEWRQNEELELSGGTEIQRQFRFEGIHEPDFDLDRYEIDAQLVDVRGSADGN